MTTMTRRRLLQISTGILATTAFGVRPGVTGDLKRDLVTLRITSRTIDVHGKPARVYGISSENNFAGLRADKDHPFLVRLVNELDRDSLIHWHGLTPPSEQDGVPGLSQPALQSGMSYDYDFVHNRSGTHWMHSHLGLQEQQLLAAPLIVHDPDNSRLDEQEVVVMLHDFSFRSPEEILEGLIQDSGMTMPMTDDGGQATHQNKGGMAMTEMDHSQMSSVAEVGTVKDETMTSAGHQGGMVHFNDVNYDAYLANDRTLSDPEIVRVESGGRVRLRIINAAAATNFLIDLGAIDGELIAVDGDPITPLPGQSFDLAIAQRADISIRLPAGQGAYPILAWREDGTAQTGIILATKSAQVKRVPEQADSRSRPLNLVLERQISALAPLATRVAERTHVLDLTGSHSGYDWGLNEKAYDPTDPIAVADGERVEVILRNKTAMPHPIHLHGHHFQVVAIDGRRYAGAVRDTVLVPPRRSVTVAFDADNPGHWALHCHQLYHMAAGMMTSVRYEGYGKV